MFSMSFTTLFAILSIIFAVLLMAFSRYREWLFYLMAGMGFWLILEFIAFGLRYFFDLEWLNSYAMGFLGVLGVLTIMFVIHDYRVAKRHMKTSNKKYIEHTPLIEQD